MDRHSELIDELFGQTPVVFRNTELIYNNALAELIDQGDRFRGVLTEGADQVTAGRPANFVYAAPNGLPVLLKNYRLSDDIAFRFTRPTPGSVPGQSLTAGRFARQIAALEDESFGNQPSAQVCNLFMDFETFGEHHWKDTGIFNFLAELPAAVLAAGQRFLTPRESLDEFEPVDTFDCPQVISWADRERDLSAWAGNAMQSSALGELFRLRDDAMLCPDAEAYRDWRRLSTSDHFYYMCTKAYDDGNVHQYFSPYESPYDSYINFMNVLDNLRARTQADAAAATD